MKDVKPSGKPPSTCTAFAGHRCVGSGSLTQVAREVKVVSDRGEEEPILVFNDRTGESIELDLRGTIKEVVERVGRLEKSGDTIAKEKPRNRGPGRPKLGVIPREVTLLPGQWDWLDEQPGGASAALRRLIYDAKLSSQGKDHARQAQEAVYRFMTTMAGNFPGFEEALRAFYRRDHARFGMLVKEWPKDVCRHLKKLMALAN